MLTVEKRRRAFGVGSGFAAGAAVWFVGGAYVVDRADLVPATLRAVMVGVFAIALLLAMLAVWQLRRARDQQWDGWGVGSFVLLFPSYAMVFLFGFSVVMSVVTLLTDTTGALVGE